MYSLLCISLALAFLLVVNLLVAGFASAIWRVIDVRAREFDPRSRSQIIFGLRMLPMTAAALFVLAFLVPAYIIYEPEASGEVVGGKLAVLAIASSLGVAFAFFRVVRTWIVTRRLAASWLDNAETIAVDGIDVPVYKIRHPFPVLAVIGVVRPRIFVAEVVLESLSKSEFRAAIAHEQGHLTALDNLKRTLLRICRDLLVFPFGTSLDRAWSESAEAIADEYAARSRGGLTALDLASALVKIGKMVPPGITPSLPVGSFLVEEYAGDITYRVRRLIRISDDNNIVVSRMRSGHSAAFWLWSISLAVMLILPAADSRILLALHSATEYVVRILQ